MHFTNSFHELTKRTPPPPPHSPTSHTHHRPPCILRSSLRILSTAVLTSLQEKWVIFVQNPVRLSALSLLVFGAGVDTFIVDDGANAGTFIYLLRRAGKGGSDEDAGLHVRAALGSASTKRAATPGAGNGNKEVFVYSAPAGFT